MIEQNWLPQCDGDLLKFLLKIDVATNEAGKEALQALFEERPQFAQTIDFDTYPWEALTVEAAFLARVYTVYCHDNKRTERLDDILPDAVSFASIVQAYNSALLGLSDTDKFEEEFIVLQLLDIAKVVDYGDETGRRKMFTLMRDLLQFPDQSDLVIDGIVEILYRLSMDENDFLRHVQ
jgi:condensin complex subunit 3